ncbi:TPR-like protein [Tilletiaria anomala UBC 951]|uniref:TPR-like protein n=1 Tax=Tilletiaria anomala (strain ATCC 24038 / CBS 436.72 / UBC 951) TaxID=1037660 RepID=A0A066WHU8_TILAU|nr:TPR-like protein [Tilletiaria anomala UBC 951]KDN53351.1 TPR-like protein [Tilletiaria anomala UBC 951]
MHPLLRSGLRTYATSTTEASSVEDPSHAEALRFSDEGTTFLENGQVDKAKDAYKKSIEVKETSTALFNLGVCYYHEQDLPNAIKSWEDSLRISPNSSDTHTNLASAYALSSPSRPDLAVKHLKTAASISPSDPEIQYNLAAVLEAVEQLEEALIAYKRAFDGGIERASQNIRNVNAKILSARLLAEANESQTSPSSS